MGPNKGVYACPSHNNCISIYNACTYRYENQKTSRPLLVTSINLGWLPLDLESCHAVD